MNAPVSRASQPKWYEVEGSKYRETRWKGFTFQIRHRTRHPSIHYYDLYAKGRPDDGFAWVLIGDIRKPSQAKKVLNKYVRQEKADRVLTL